MSLLLMLVWVADMLRICAAVYIRRRMAETREDKQRRIILHRCLERRADIIAQNKRVAAARLAEKSSTPVVVSADPFEQRNHGGGGVYLGLASSGRIRIA